MTRQKPGAFIWAILALLGLIWGASFPAVSVALTGFGPLTVAAGRIILAALVLLALTFGLGHGLPSFKTAIGRRIWLHAAGGALFFNSLPFFLLGWGQLYVSAGFAGITMAVVPLFVLPMAHFLVPDEFMNKRKSLGFLMGFIGVVVLIGPKAFASSGAEVEMLARLACLAATACYASGNIITRLSPPGPQLSFSAAALLLAAFMITPLAWLLEGIPQVAPTPAILALIYLGLAPTALATIILVKIIKTAGSSFLVLVNFQVPVWAALMGVGFLSEELPAQFIVALGFILAGLAISQKRQTAG